MERQGYGAAEIAATLAEDHFEVPEEELSEPDPPPYNPYAAVA
jgi:hypothetical protein